ncbi:hypothetical protein Y88_1750 [Novosphingobium nitrogenifigens DSM 19370]|uniref:Uncharacterized protein n=1 Tax=Novosphingobium nitrogenifigens DSM 19370 TaxID=983920 RepID=F1Z407_9SPHN|nr:hypothetical protein Y88_1750 [Novosphingobium nitrogenifigens DSM 19370]
METALMRTCNEMNSLQVVSLRRRAALYQPAMRETHRRLV